MAGPLLVMSDIICDKIISLFTYGHTCVFVMSLLQLITCTGAVLLSQWCQPEQALTYNEVSDKLDLIAGLVRKELAATHPGHPATEPLRTPLHGMSCDMCCRFVYSS